MTLPRLHSDNIEYNYRPHYQKTCNSSINNHNYICSSIETTPSFNHLQFKQQQKPKAFPMTSSSRIIISTSYTITSVPKKVLFHTDYHMGNNTSVKSRLVQPHHNNYMLSNEARILLKSWMFAPENFGHPYPTLKEKEALAHAANISIKQVTNWFTNARKHLWQPVLKRMGLDVKKFLTTGRGGCRTSSPRQHNIPVPLNFFEIVNSLSKGNSTIPNTDTNATAAADLLVNFNSYHQG